MKNRPKQRGETLIEIIIAMGILAIGSFVASILITSTLRSTLINKNYLLAVNLSREGMEAVRAIRDTNWLIFSHNTDDCWDVLDDETVQPPVDCNNVNKLSSGAGKTYYRVNLNPINHATSPYKWVLEPAGASSDFTPATSAEDRKFYLLAPDSANANLYRHQKNDGTNEYVSGDTSFYRAITIEDVENKNDEIRVTSVVHWLEAGEFNEIVTETILTNYQ